MSEFNFLGYVFVGILTIFFVSLFGLLIYLAIAGPIIFRILLFGLLGVFGIAVALATIGYGMIWLYDSW